MSTFVERHFLQELLQKEFLEKELLLESRLGPQTDSQAVREQSHRPERLLKAHLFLQFLHLRFLLL